MKTANIIILATTGEEYNIVNGAIYITIISIK
jgi:hypothetical protein